jgi:LysW-gamma-L-lysine carboxypeptidase
MMGDKEPVAILERALSVYSPSSKEGKLAKYLCTQMRDLGYSNVRVDKGGNALGETGEGSVRVLLCGHMDTVPGELPVGIRSGVLYGRGAADAKSALCALLVAGPRAAGSGVAMTFAGVTREEGDGLGIRTLIENGERYDFAIFGEPSGPHRITVGYRGRVGLHVSLKTRGGHAGSPWAGGSAFVELQRLLRRLRLYESRNTSQGNHFGSLSISPTIVQAGTYHNVLPSSCEVAMDIRVPPGMNCADVQAKVGEILTSVEKRNPGTSHHFDEATEPYESERGSTLVRAFQRAIITETGARPTFVKKTGTGDMNTYAASSKAECVTYGPGDPKLSHTDMEQVSVGDYLASIDIIAEAVRQLGFLRRESAR